MSLLSHVYCVRISLPFSLSTPPYRTLGGTWAGWASATRSSVLGHLTRTDWTRRPTSSYTVDQTKPMTDGNHPDRNFAPLHAPLPCLGYVFIISLLISARIQHAYPGSHTTHAGTNIYLLPPLAAAASPTPPFFQVVAALLFPCSSQAVVCCVLFHFLLSKLKNKPIYTVHIDHSARHPAQLVAGARPLTRTAPFIALRDLSGSRGRENRQYIC